MQKFNCMKRVSFVIVLLLAFFSMNAQIAPDRYWVQFTDKNDSPYSISEPEKFLGERSIQRRVKYGIALDEKDLPVNPSYIEAVENAGAVVLNPSKWLNGVTVEVTNFTVINEINKLPFVKKTRVLQDEPLKQALKESGYVGEINGNVMVPGENSRGFYGNAYTQIELLNGVGLHEMGYQGEGVWIGICDSGYEGADVHSAFDNMREEGRLLGTRDFVYKNGVVYSDDYHGTACLSLMAAYLPDNYVGTAPKASYFLCRTENINSENVIEEYNWVSAAEYLDSLGVDIISTSLGYISFDDEQMTHEYSDLDGKTCVSSIGADIACSRGILCVNAAGNDGDNKFPYIGAPADAKNVLTVGGVKSDGERTFFSSIGPTYDGRIKPDVMAFAYNVTVASPSNGFYEGNGTSFACPSLAGMVACLWQARRDNSAEEIRETVKRVGNNFSTPNSEYGYGIPDFMEALDVLNLKDCDIFEEKSMISAFPNPSNGIVNLDVNYNGKCTICVSDLMGNVLYMIDNHNGDIDELNGFLSGLTEGVYFIRVFDNEFDEVIKLIKY